MSFSFLESRGNERADGRVEKKRVSGGGRDEGLTEFCREHLEQLSLQDLAERVSVEWNPRMRSSAGRALWPHGLIQLNPRIGEISTREVRRTVLHELAHLIAYERHPYRRIKGHGREWRKACCDVGIPGESATHQLPLPTRTMRKQWHYQCPVCRKSFERVRRFKGTVACYHCCQHSNGGSYHDAFRLIEKRLSGSGPAS